MNKLQNLTKQKGFTIVELLIVIVVIAILAAITIVAFTGVQQRARDSERVSDINSISKALTAMAAESDNGLYPAAADVQTALNGYETANLAATVTAKVSATLPTASTPNVYGYAPCGTTPNFTGATLTWWKEASPSGAQPVVVGSC